MLTGKELRRFEKNAPVIPSVAFSPDGHFVVTAGPRGALLLDVATGKKVRAFEGHTRYVMGVAFSSDGRFVLTGSVDSSARLWDAATGEEIRRFEVVGKKRVQSVAFSSDGRFVLTGGEDGIARLWGAASGEIVRRFEGHSAEINTVAISPGGQVVLSGSRDNTARLWDSATAKEVHRLESEWPVYSVAFDPNGQCVATGTIGRASLWDIDTGKQIQQYEGESFEEGGVEFSRDGRLLLIGRSLWDGSQGKEVLRFGGESGSPVLSPDGRFVLNTSSDNTAVLLDVSTGQEIQRFRGHSGEISAGVFSSDGRFVLTGSEDKTVRLWNCPTGEEIRRFGGLQLADILPGLTSHTHVTMSADNRLVLATSEEEWNESVRQRRGIARVWDAKTGREVWRLDYSLDEYQGDQIKFSPDGGFILVGSQDGTLSLWSVAAKEEVRRFEGHPGPAGPVAFSPDGLLILAASPGGITLWEAATGRRVWQLKEHLNWLMTQFSPDS